MLNHVQSKHQTVAPISGEVAASRHNVKNWKGMACPAVMLKHGMAAIGLLLSPLAAAMDANSKPMTGIRPSNQAIGVVVGGRRLLEKASGSAMPGHSSKQSYGVSYENYILPGNAPSAALDGGVTVPSKLVINARATGPTQAGQLFTVPINGPGPITLTNTPGDDPTVCLDVPAGNYSNRVRVQTYDCNGGKNQNWTFAGSEIKPAGNTAYCLDVAGFGTTNGTIVQLYKCNGGSNQAWSLFQES